MCMGTKMLKVKRIEKEISAIWAPHFSIYFKKGVIFLPTIILSLSHWNSNKIVFLLQPKPITSQPYEYSI